MAKQLNGAIQDSAIVTTRRATLADVPAMMPLLNTYARQAEILPRMADDVYRSIREWVVVENASQIIGMGALLIMWHDLAEVRSLVVDPAWHGLGVGRKIVTALVEEAKGLQLPSVFALTRKPDFFLRLGFQLTELDALPLKVQKDCVICPKFHACDEIAVIFETKDILKS